MSKLPNSKFSILWITDPWSTLAHSNDTTLRLMHEAMKMDLPTFWSASDFILNTSKRQTIAAVECDSISSGNSWHERVPMEMETSRFHQIHYRVDPPVDFNYISLIDKLLQQGVEDKQILNPPNLIKTQSEKIPPPALHHLTPKSEVISSRASAEVALALFEHDREVVLKPLNLAQSIGVKKIMLPSAHAQAMALLDKETEGFTTPLLIQEYLKSVFEGETRVWYVNGEIIAALKKFPAKGDFRVLIDEGSKIKKHELKGEELSAAEEVGAVLKQQGAGMAAIDFIDHKISDYNITSPGLLTQMEAVYGGKNFARVILEKLMEMSSST